MQLALQNTEAGVHMDGQVVNNLRFSDDIDLRGRSCKKWINNVQEDLNCLQLNMKEAMDIVRDR